MHDDSISDRAQAVVDELPAGHVVGDKVILSKPQAVAIMGGGVSLAAVLGVGTGRASAQTDPAKLGSESNPIVVDASNLGLADTASGYELTINGQTLQINE